MAAILKNGCHGNHLGIYKMGPMPKMFLLPLLTYVPSFMLFPFSEVF
jgi:hypothetical protein